MPLSTDLTGWTNGPLPHDLEQIALKLFARQYPKAAWADPSFSVERNDCRRFALQLRVDFIKLDRWNLGNMLPRLEEGFGRIVFGDRGPSKAEAVQLRDYSSSCLEDLFALFGGDAMAKRVSESWRDSETEPAKKASIQ